MSSTHRLTAVDALRGFALCGILLVNIPQITRMPGIDADGAVLPARRPRDAGSAASTRARQTLGARAAAEKVSSPHPMCARFRSRRPMPYRPSPP